MTFFGRKDPERHAAELQTADEQAIARYRYMLRTAPPETIEQAHAEAFAQLTPEQRRLLLQKMAETVPASERALLEQGGATPQALARLATRYMDRLHTAGELTEARARTVYLAADAWVIGSTAGSVVLAYDGLRSLGW